MTMLILTGPPPTKSERAIASAKAARKMTPTVQSFIRMLTRNPKIKFAWTGGNSRTDGETIYLRVPIGLGDERSHDRPLCGKRGSDLIQRCDACAAEEAMWITMFHECAHIIFGTFEAIPDEERGEILRRAIQTECDGQVGSKRAEAIKNRLDQHGHVSSNYLYWSSLVNPYLPKIINACEDIRVNLCMEEARPGTRPMFAAKINEVFGRGMEMDDGSIFKWIDQPLNAQAIIGVYCKTAGYNYSTWLDPKVVADLDDPELAALIRRMSTARSVKSIYMLSFPLLENLRRLGYCLDVDDPEDEPHPTEDTPQENKQDSDKTDSDDTPQDGEQDSDDDDGQNDDGDQADGEDEGDGGDTEDGDDGESGSEQDGDGEQGDQPGETDSDNGGNGQPEQGDDRGDPGDETDQYESGEGGQGEPDGDMPDDYNGSEWDGDGSQMGNGDVPQQEMGTPDEVERIVAIFGGHDEDEGDGTWKSDPNGFNSDPEQQDDQAAVERALNQAEYFDRPSDRLTGLVVHRKGEADDGDSSYYGHGAWRGHVDDDDLIKIPERILAPALQQLRIAFADNRRANVDRNRTSGRINAKVLGRRVPVGDDRLFGKRTVPGKKDYFVCIGLDVSGSTQGYEIQIIKAAALAKAELLHRLGVKFAVYAHTGRGGTVDLYEVKSPEEPWGRPQRLALAALQPSGGNYDGHSMEFYRKVVERRHETDRIVLYYTDGALNNIGEEFDVFRENVEICKKLNITVIGVEIGTDSGITESVGLDCIRLDEIEDVPKVVKEMQKRLR
jgi:hypothetical protein